MSTAYRRNPAIEAAPLQALANGGVLDEGVIETGKGVALAAATNVAGFGALAFGNYPAMRSVGIVALIGSVTCLLTALTLVPALMARTAASPKETT